LGDHHVKFGPAPSGKPPVSIDITEDDDKGANASAPASGAAPAQTTVNLKAPPSADSAKITKGKALMNWMVERGQFAAKNPELFKMLLETWAHRFAILMLPIAALFLSILFIFQRRFYVFDHVIFSMHSLSFQGLLASVVFLLGPWIPFIGLLFLAAPVHLFVHMRGTYKTSVIGTLIRMGLLFLGSVVAVSLLTIGVFWVGLSLLKPH
jgi:hypothetical protein